MVVPFYQIAALQEAYDELCVKRGTTAVPYFLMNYTADTVQVAPLADWDAFVTDTKKVAKLLFVISRLLLKKYLCIHSCLRAAFFRSP